MNNFLCNFLRFTEPECRHRRLLSRKVSEREKLFGKNLFGIGFSGISRFESNAPHDAFAVISAYDPTHISNTVGRPSGKRAAVRERSLFQDYTQGVK